jgi:hypothetical protein
MRVIATNTSHSWIHQRHDNEMLAKLDFLVVQNLSATTETEGAGASRGARERRLFADGQFTSPAR